MWRRKDVAKAWVNSNWYLGQCVLNLPPKGQDYHRSRHSRSGCPPCQTASSQAWMPHEYDVCLHVKGPMMDTYTAMHHLSLSSNQIARHVKHGCHITTSTLYRTTVYELHIVPQELSYEQLSLYCHACSHNYQSEQVGTPWSSERDISQHILAI